MRLSTRRKHPAARPLTLVLALLLMGALYAAITPSSSQADPNNGSQVAKGKELFAVTCASCHGLNGQGTSDAPPLIGVGAAAVDFQMGTGRMPMAKPAAQGPAGKTTYTAEEIAAIAAYVASLGTGPEIPSADEYSTTGLTSEELARGGELFRTNCSACHNYEGGGGALSNGAYAPSLKNTSAKHIVEALRTGPYQMPVFNKNTLSEQDTKEIIGYLTQLHSQPNNGGFSLSGIGPVAEGFWGWLIGIGSCVAVATWLAKRGARAR